MKNHRRLISVFGILLIVTLACSLPGSLDPGSVIQTLIPPEAQTQVVSMLTPAATASAGSGGATSRACQNELYPVVVGAAWSYSFTGAVPGNFTRSIAALTTDGFTDQDNFDSGVVRTGRWTCAAGALTALDPGSGSADTANVQTSGLDATFQTTAMDGVTLPADVSSGNSWSQNFTIEGNQTIGGETIPSKNVTSYTCIAGEEESVTVTAGTFNSRRVVCTVDITITITMAGSEIPTNINSTSTAWYAPGVGMVLTESQLSDGSIYTIELTSYNIP